MKIKEDNSFEIIIKNLSNETIKSINKLSKEKGISRQQFLKNHLENFFMGDFRCELDDKYEALIKQMISLLYTYIDKLEKNNLVMKEILNKKINK